MHTIQIDQQVFEIIARLACSADITPNNALRRILKLPASPGVDETSKPEDPDAPLMLPSIIEFIRSDLFKRNHTAIDRYIEIIAWLHANKTKQFSDIATAFRCGQRRYFAKSKAEIENSGKDCTPKQIPGSPFWVLSKLGNPQKRMVVARILHDLNYPPGDINLVLAELPDSEIHHLHAQRR